MADPKAAAATKAVVLENDLEEMLEERHKLWVTAAIGKVRLAIAALEETDVAFNAEQQGILDKLVEVLEDEDSSLSLPEDPPGFVSEFRF